MTQLEKKELIFKKSGPKEYPIEMEIHSETAMFSDPSTGPDACSYAAPTYSAVKGIFERVGGHSPGAIIIPTEVHICNPIHFDSFSYNGRFAATRKSVLIKNGEAVQRRETMLVNVAYKLFGIIRNLDDGHLTGAAAKYKGNNHAHYLQEMFKRRLKRGQGFRPICLGRSEHVPTYVGPLLNETEADESINMVIGRLLRHPFSDDSNHHGRSSWSPRYDINVRIEKGVLRYD